MSRGRQVRREAGDIIRVLRAMETRNNFAMNFVSAILLDHAARSISDAG
jgi:hypothetical protein